MGNGSVLEPGHSGHSRNFLTLGAERLNVALYTLKVQRSVLKWPQSLFQTRKFGSI